jgi:hypothetical protein
LTYLVTEITAAFSALGAATVILLFASREMLYPVFHTGVAAAQSADSIPFPSFKVGSVGSAEIYVGTNCAQSAGKFVAFKVVGVAATNAVTSAGN